MCRWCLAASSLTRPSKPYIYTPPQERVLCDDGLSRAYALYSKPDGDSVAETKRILAHMEVCGSCGFGFGQGVLGERDAADDERRVHNPTYRIHPAITPSHPTH